MSGTLPHLSDLSQNPELLDMSAFGAMNTGPTLTPKIARRVTALKGVQQEHAKIESEFQLEILALEKKVCPTFLFDLQRR